MSGFVKTDTILDKILAQKELEIGFNLAEIERRAREVAPAQPFAAALRRDTVALIAEVKHASPSKGVLIENFDPVGLATTYAQNGAAAISVLTDEKFFMGSLSDLKEVRAAVSVPVLRKDFIIDPYQVYEARAAGADATLLIVMALQDRQLADLHALITELGMAALVEVHNEAELERALKAGASLIGVNNRDLKSFHEDLGTTGRVAQLVPQNVTLVAESAIRNVADVRKMGELGAHAVLVGEGLVKADNIAEQVKIFSSQPHQRADKMIEPILIITLLDRSYSVLKQQADGLTQEDSLLQMPFRANCLNWVLGHILSSRSGFMIALGMPPVWTDEQRAIYLRGSEAITQANADKAARLDDMLRDLDRSQEQIVACLKTKTFADMLLPSDRPNMTMGERLGHSVWHEAYHTGNTEALRQLAGTDDQVIQ